MAYPDDNPKTIHGTAKPGIFHVPPVALLELGRVMRVGVRKYGHYNWRDQKVTTSTYYDAIQRHLMLFLEGEDNDTDPKGDDTLHLAHVMACCAILIDAQRTGMLNDDRRPTPGGNVVARFIAEHTKPVETPVPHPMTNAVKPRAPSVDLNELERFVKGGLAPTPTK